MGLRRLDHASSVFNLFTLFVYSFKICILAITPMKTLARIIFGFISNAVALWAASQFIAGFKISPVWTDLLYVAAVFTLLNLFLKPILDLILGPIIFLTLGVGFILVNMLLLYILGIITAKIMIAGLLPLFYGSLIIGLVNFAFHFSAKRV